MKKSKANSLPNDIDKLAYSLYYKKNQYIMNIETFVYVKNNSKLYNPIYIKNVILDNYEKAHKILRKQKLLKLNDNR